MTLPSVTLIHICGGVTPIPGRVTQLEIFNVTYNQVLLIWNDKNVLSKCIKTYEIEFSFDGIHNFTRINRNDVVFLSFQYAPQEEEVRDLNTGVGEIEQEEEYKKEQTIGWYRIRAIDYWGRTGHYSKVVKYFENERHIYTHL
ncbi:alpha-L-iduronidase-like [Chrysoperla carnea]|uniref:alpha-L-iduronidase-like n=1 Tax=Chrysoperla carnea TaxID=189513 RepID=UPI001D060A7A|nr:alpha-L-iduronidase-like [Chrysoperla carnea]